MGRKKAIDEKLGNLEIKRVKLRRANTYFLKLYGRLSNTYDDREIKEAIKIASRLIIEKWKKIEEDIEDLKSKKK